MVDVQKKKIHIPMSPGYLGILADYEFASVFFFVIA
jgi:hypothetical protein